MFPRGMVRDLRDAEETKGSTKTLYVAEAVTRRANETLTLTS